MLTPAGKECKYFYGDYHRGRKNEECRLLDSADLIWSPYLCKKCPIPEILLANSCENIKFQPRLVKPFFFMKPQVWISAFCVKINAPVDEPRIGCGQCHPLNKVFVITPDEPNSSN
jgi:hypothetical protein